jgi:hypothetical protein
MNFGTQSRRPLQPRRQAATALLLALAATASLAQEPAARSEPRNQFDLAAWSVKQSYTMRVAPFFGSAPAEDLNLENDFGLPRRSTGFALGYTRLIGQAWHFSADLLRTSRDNELVMARSVRIGDAVFAQGTRLKARATMNYSSFAGGVALVQSGGTEFGVRAGGVVASGQLRIDDGAPFGSRRWTMDDVLPMLGLFLNTRASDSVHLDARVDFAGRNGARALHAQLGLRWQLNPHFGLSAGLRALNGRSNTEDLDFFVNKEERSKYRLSGPQLGARLAF